MQVGAPRLLAGMAAAVTLAAIAGSSSQSSAAFNAQRMNPGNSLTASEYFGFFSSGGYTGNNADNRAITGVGFMPNLVIVKGNTSQTSVARSSSMSGDLSKPLSGGTALTANVIQSLDANGFTLGTNARVNGSGVGYQWMAFRAQEGLLGVGSYTGNGSAQSIAGLGFSPEYVAVFSAAGQAAVQRYAGATTSFLFSGDTGNATRITALGADGFSVGNQNTVNANGTTYHWVAFNEVPGVLDVGAYTGNGADNRSITGVGFQPQYVTVRANDTATARTGVHRPATLAGDSSLHHTATANLANAIQALQSGGFQVGTAPAVNAAGVSYPYLAVRDSAGA
jgi:hypothetical protein